MNGREGRRKGKRRGRTWYWKEEEEAKEMEERVRESVGVCKDEGKRRKEAKGRREEI